MLPCEHSFPLVDPVLCVCDIMVNNTTPSQFSVLRSGLIEAFV